MGHHDEEAVVKGASIETTLELWAPSLRDVRARMRPPFSRKRVAASASSSWMGCSTTNGARPAGDAGPWCQQAILGRGRWDPDALRDVMRDLAIEHLGTDDAVPVIDETGFLKQGKASCGVGHQYTGSAGR